MIGTHPRAPRPQLKREVVSFARRDGRHDARTAHAFEPPYSRFLVEPARQARSTSLDPAWRFDATAAFGRTAPLVVEIGTGTGDAILAAAQDAPGVDHLAVEVYRPGLARTILSADALGLDNLRVLEADAGAFLAQGAVPGSVDEIRIFFPDPWPKLRHHKRRLVGPAVVAHCARALRPGGRLRLATDWADYAAQMREAALSCADLEGGREWAPRFSGRPVTRFERKAQEAGREVRELDLVRR